MMILFCLSVVCVSCKGYSDLFGVSTEINPWNSLGHSCEHVDPSLFCSTRTKACVPDTIYGTDINILPDTFAAWLNAYLIKSASIIYEGCYKVLPSYKHGSTQYKITDVLKCAGKCLSNGVVVHSYFGIGGSQCYCFLEDVAAQSRIVDVSGRTTENTCHQENDQIKVYRALIHTNLGKDNCPVAYPIDTIEVFLEDCDNRNSFYCNGEDIVEFNPLPWYKAQEFCKNRSMILGNKYEHNNNVQWKFWTRGLQYTEYYMNSPLPLFKTRCAALVRNKSHFEVKAFNCSTLLPTLCQLKDNTTTLKSNVSRPTTLSYTISTTTTPQQDRHVTSKVPITYTYTDENMTTIVSTNKSTTPVLFSETPPTTKPTIETVSIVLPVVGILIVAVIVIVIVIIRRRVCCQTSNGSYGRTITGASEGTSLTIHSSAESSAVDL